MDGFDIHRHAARAQDAFDGVGDLGRHRFLGLQSLGEDLHDAGQLADADNPIGRQIRDMGRTQDRHHMMFAMALERDAPSMTMSS